MSNEVKIGMLAPSRAGKTSLMSAIFQATKDRLSGNESNIQCYALDQATKLRIQRAMAEFNACTASDDIFEVPELTGTQQSGHYQFVVSVGDGLARQGMGFNFLDYPGGILGTQAFDQILPHLNESLAMIVPIPSEILMEWKKTQKVNNPLAIAKNIAAQCMLCDQDTRNAIEDWAKRRASAKKHSILLFVPIKCEAYFDDNGGTKDESVLLHSAVEDLYIKQLNLSPEIKKYIQIETFAVDTYGVVELRDVVLSHDKTMLTSTFRKRLRCENKLSIKGAFEVLATIMDFKLHAIASTLGLDKTALEERIKNRGIFERLWYNWIAKDPVKKALADNIRENDSIYQAITTISAWKTISAKRHREHNMVVW